MATVTGLTAARMIEIEGRSIVNGSVNSDGDLVLQNYFGSNINAGRVIGPKGDKGDTGGATLPNVVTYPSSNLSNMVATSGWYYVDNSVTTGKPTGAGNGFVEFRRLGSSTYPCYQLFVEAGTGKAWIRSKSTSSTTWGDWASFGGSSGGLGGIDLTHSDADDVLLTLTNTTPPVLRAKTDWNSMSGFVASSTDTSVLKPGTYLLTSPLSDGPLLPQGNPVLLTIAAGRDASSPVYGSVRVCTVYTDAGAIYQRGIYPAGSSSWYCVRGDYCEEGYVATGWDDLTTTVGQLDNSAAGIQLNTLTNVYGRPVTFRYNYNVFCQGYDGQTMSISYSGNYSGVGMTPKVGLTSSLKTTYNLSGYVTVPAASSSGSPKNATIRLVGGGASLPAYVYAINGTVTQAPLVL